MPRVMSYMRSVQKPFWGLLLSTFVLLAGCQPYVQVRQRALPDRSRQIVATPQWAVHDLVLLAVDFDPPLDQLDLVAGRGVTLMAAIQNSGQRLERDVTITARLYDGERGSAGQALLLESRAFLPQIAPGEIAIVRFDPLRSLPTRSHYYLNVEVTTGAGEIGGTSNVQSFEIVVRPTPAVASPFRAD